ncbi:aminopeptidase P family protein [Mesorhizobium waimense]|uniref:Aminopeptidase P family protein n=1 Tax=Mesorhizobium waimense TaxID=1300307 RepID=A0A3A5JUK6_9HYPH|nr:M24 family metallopeptidase [Mesorhizobium waimense]RJT23993.1 aminopeptidase P family protein [Mesorhizobium waimense]
MSIAERQPSKSIDMGHKGSFAPTGTITVGPSATGRGRPVEPGDVIRLDLGSTVDGYTSDSARTVVFGKPSQDVYDVYTALYDAFHVGLDLLRPGIALNLIYYAAMQAMHDRGYGMYSRGHFGHSVGASLFVEEWPFIAADHETVIEPDMVLAYELPLYIRGLGAFTLEDQFAVSTHSVEACWSLPRGLIVQN